MVCERSTRGAATDYYREMAHCRALPESDEMLRILRAMQFLTVLIEQTPVRLATEREQLAIALSSAIALLQSAHQAGVAYQKQLEARLSKLPEEVALQPLGYWGSADTPMACSCRPPAVTAGTPNGQIRWLPKGNIAGQAAFVGHLFG